MNACMGWNPSLLLAKHPLDERIIDLVKLSMEDWSIQNFGDPWIPQDGNQHTSCG